MSRQLQTAALTPTAIAEYDDRQPTSEATEQATFGTGCFWGPDAEFGARAGVVRTRVGYAGGTTTNPTYNAIGDHTEVVQIDYDPTRLSFSDVLDLVFQNHDPHSQARKRQYQNVVLTATAEQQAALTAWLDDHGNTAAGIDTRIERLGTFTPAEDYHQKYSLRSNESVLSAFDEAGYDDTQLRESPLAAALNGRVAGHDATVPLVDAAD